MQTEFGATGTEGACRDGKGRGPVGGVETRGFVRFFFFVGEKQWVTDDWSQRQYVNVGVCVCLLWDHNQKVCFLHLICNCMQIRGRAFLPGVF